MKKRQLELTVQIFNSFEEADESDLDYYANLSLEERFKHLQKMRELCYGYESATRRLQRVIEITERAPC
ncbi:MAG: hypothetical protein SNJ55_10870 [Chloroherpetonaceae bacterium]